MLDIIAWGIVDGGSGVPNNFRGVVTVSRTGVGAYTLTLDDGILLDNGEMMLTVTPQTAIATIVQSGGGTDSAKFIKMFDAAGAPSDRDFYFELKRLNLL